MTGERKWTPGPWMWIGPNLEAPSGDVYSVETRCMSYCYGGYPVATISDSDKALIAAVPNLYDELAAMHEFFSRYSRLNEPAQEEMDDECAERLEQARIVLARARGES